MEVSDTSDPGKIEVRCTCSYDILWADSSITDVGERHKTVWISPGEVPGKRPDHMELYGLVREDDYCGDVGLLYRTVECDLVFEGGAKVKADEATRSKLSGLLSDMWVDYPEIPRTPDGNTLCRRQ